MSVRILTATALLAIVALGPAVAQGKADFSGIWKFNVEKSDPMVGVTGGGGGGRGGMAMAVTTITQTAAKLTIETKFGDQTQNLAYNLDGSESVNTGMRGESRSKAVWDGPDLVINSENTFSGPNGPMTRSSKEVRTLSADGKTMTVTTTRTTPNGEQTTKRVFDRQ
jgi:hypothetical protein